jgi:hypothetical protein
MERILLIFALFGSMWAIIWLIYQEQSQEPGKKDASPFAMRDGADLTHDQKQPRSKDG